MSDPDLTRISQVALLGVEGVAKGAPGGIALEQLIESETALVAQRHGPSKGDYVGVALSGGGIRSGTLSLGFLKVLTQLGLLRAVDYLSTVSGAGYASGYVHSSVAAGEALNTDLFEGKERKRRLIAAGKYLAPGRGIEGSFGVLKIFGTVLFSTLLNLAWLAAFVTFTSNVLRAMFSLTLGDPKQAWIGVAAGLGMVALWALALHLVGVFLSGIPGAARLIRRLASHSIGVVLAAVVTVLVAILAAPITNACIDWIAESFGRWHAIARDAFATDLELPLALTALLASVWFVPKLIGSSLEKDKTRVGVWAGGVALAIAGLVLALAIALHVTPLAVQAVRSVLATSSSDTLAGVLISFAIFVTLGFMANANALSSNALFSDLIAKAFLRTHAKEGATKIDCARKLRAREGGLRLAELDTTTLPYPLYNACVNLFDEHDENFAGARGSDYFVMSPGYCGSRLTGYCKTTDKYYKTFTLANAVACSAASVSPLMGSDTKPAFSFVLGLFNIKLDRWLPNPRHPGPLWYRFWPYYQLRALLGKLNTRLGLVNVSDGGFIDNLGVFELLRRRCKLIIALDNTYDPHYEFKYLRNLVMRARSELGLKITFRDDPEQTIRPAAAHGFSQQHFAIADVATIPGYPDAWQNGVLVYVKASLTQPKTWKDPANEDPSFRYKTYHPLFPQESTGDQFFDQDQWSAYYTLGQEIAARCLGFSNLHAAEEHAFATARQERDDLRNWMLSRY